MRIATKPIDAVLLDAELTDAAVPHHGVSVQFLGAEVEILTHDPDGAAVELPPSASPVVEAHVAPPRVIEFGTAVPIEGLVTTTDANPHELLRFPLALQSGYDVEVRIMGVDAGNGAVKKLKRDVTMKRLNAGPLLVGTVTTLVNHPDPAAVNWDVAFSFSGNDAVVAVTGAAGRTINWIARGTVGVFAPAGLNPE